MTPNQYLEKAKTLIRAHWGQTPDLMHGFLGIASESGELLGLAKKWYRDGGDEPDKIDIVDELGDLLWYIAVVMSCKDITFDECFNANIIKLEYRDKFGKNKPEERKLQIAALQAA